jgi:hypothetical protein
VPQLHCAARCFRLGILRAVGRLLRAARVFADERTRPCTARAVCDHAARMRRPNGGGLMRDREPSDFEDVMAAGRTTPLASSPPTVPRRAWQFANSVSQLLTPDASGRGIWAWHTAPNVTSTTRIATRLLQRAGGESAAAIAKSCVCSVGLILRKLWMHDCDIRRCECGGSIRKAGPERGFTRSKQPFACWTI